MKNNKSYGSLSINYTKVKIANNCWNSLHSLIPVVKGEDKFMHSHLEEMLKK